MRKIFAIAWLHLSMVARSKGAVAAFIGLPLLMTALFGFIMNGLTNSETGQRFPVALVDLDHSFASQTLTEALAQEHLLRIAPAAEADVPKLFADRKVEAGIVIPAGFQGGLADGKALEINLLTAPGGNMQMAVYPAVQRQVIRVAGDFRTAVRAAGARDDAALRAAYARTQADRASAGAEVQVEALSRSTAQTATYAPGVGEQALGFTVMFVMMQVFSMTGSILQERRTGTWGRLLSTPTGRVTLVGGYLLSFYATGMVQFGLLASLTSLLFKVNWGPLLPLLTVASAFVLCSAGLGLFLAGLVRTAEQQNVAGVIVVVATSMLGGVYWPLELLSPTLQRIGHLTPQAWAMDGFREVLLRGGSWSGLVWPLAVLAGLTVVFLAVGLTRVRYE